MELHNRVISLEDLWSGKITIRRRYRDFDENIHTETIIKHGDKYWIREEIQRYKPVTTCDRPPSVFITPEREIKHREISEEDALRLNFGEERYGQVIEMLE